MLISEYYGIFKSPLGELVITGDEEVITGLYLPDHAHYLQAKQLTLNPDSFENIFSQLHEYFGKKREYFDLPIALAATDFQIKVWQALCTIGYGQTKSYQEIANQIDTPKAYRAVGTANGRNPISIIIPCHRVIGANGKMAGYGGGVAAKEWLLNHEKSISI